MDSLHPRVRPLAKGSPENSRLEAHDVTKKTHTAVRASVLRDLDGCAGSARRRGNAGWFRNSGAVVAVYTPNRKHRSASDGQHGSAAHRKHDAGK